MSEESQEFDAQIARENHWRRLEREERFGEPEDEDDREHREKR